MGMTQQQLIEAIEDYERIENLLASMMPDIELEPEETYHLFLLNKMIRKDPIFKSYLLMAMLLWEACCHSGWHKFPFFVKKAMKNFKDLIFEVDQQIKKGEEA